MVLLAHPAGRYADNESARMLRKADEADKGLVAHAAGRFADSQSSGMLTKTGEASTGTPGPSCWPLCIESELECAAGFREDKACRGSSLLAKECLSCCS